MLNCKCFYDELAAHGIRFFCGVPDSLLKSFCAYISDHAQKKDHIISANEGGAIALSAGYYLATGRMGLVYMQNSGQGNAINPLVSLADPEVYGIPMILLIGWRGQPQVPDEPQHVKQGKITLELLDTLGIPYKIMPETKLGMKDCLEEIIKLAFERKTPVALVVKKDTFDQYSISCEDDVAFELTREDAVKILLDSLSVEDIVISTTGKASRELYEYRDKLGQGHNKDFLTIGSMGHCSQIALAIALQKPQKQVFCLDGDGAVIMHMGALAIIGSRKAFNFKHIIINNAAHDSVGGQPTIAAEISFVKIAKACGYKICFQASTANEIKDNMKILKTSEGPCLLEIKVRKGSRKDLARPSALIENKNKFMEFLSE